MAYEKGIELSFPVNAKREIMVSGLKPSGYQGVNHYRPMLVQP